jgi:preprotein translocase subunit SecY
VLIGALFLSVIAIVPMILPQIYSPLSAVSLGGTSILIAVGVAIETERELEAQMTMRNYKGFLE